MADLQVQKIVKTGPVWSLASTCRWRHRSLSEQRDHHLERKDGEHDGEHLLQSAYRHAMRNARTERNGDKRAEDESGQGRDVYVADAVWRQMPLAKAIGDVARGPGYGNRQSNRSGRSDAIAHRNIAHGEQWNDQNPACDAYQTAHYADARCSDPHAYRPRQMARGLRPSIEQHLHRGKQHKQCEHYGEVTRR